MDSKEQFLAHMPTDPGADERLVALIGHLLVEVALREFCNRWIYKGRPHPPIKYGGLVWMARARMGDQRDGDWYWDALRRLDDLRNAYGHELAPAGAPTVARDLIAMVRKEFGSKILDLVGTEYELRIALYSIYNALLIALDPGEELDRRSLLGDGLLAYMMGERAGGELEVDPSAPAAIPIFSPDGDLRG